MRSDVQSIISGSSNKASKVRALVAAGVPKPEIAQLLDISVNHVYTVISRDRSTGRAAPVRQIDASGGDVVHMVMIDEMGRIVLPPEALQLMELKGGDQVVLLGQPGEIRLLTKDKAAEGLQRALETAAPKEAALARMLLADIGK
jgi:bifunctional DNA-binding transcriptional regulator/antitoxin component of YhaV-PrlF toxin-antitoxin module